jgi:hypothetical protein
MKIIAFFMVCMALTIICIGIIILGEWIRVKRPNSVFVKWWDKHIATHVDDRLDI